MAREHSRVRYMRELPICPTIAALIAAGFAAGVAQVLLMRELLVVAFGNELSMGLLLACWLLAGALGSILGRTLLRRATDPQRPARIMVILAAFPALLLVGALALVRVAPLLLTGLTDPAAGDAVLAPLLQWLAIRPGEMLSPGQMAAIGAAVALGPAALNGAQFATGCELYSRTRERAAAGPAYAADAVGHLIGGVLLATAIVLVADPFTMALVAGAVNIVAAALLAAELLGVPRGRAALAATLALGLLALAIPGAAPVHDASMGWRWHNHNLIASVESIYGNIALMRQEPDGIYVYQSGVYSGASPPLVGTVEEPVHFTMLQHPEPRSVLLIGDGITGALREVLKHDPLRVDYVELDATLFELGAEHAAPEDASALADARVTLIPGDGRRVIDQARGEGRRWDVILVGLPDPATAQLNRFYTVEFYRQAAESLAEGGVIGWQIPGSDGYFSPSLLRLHRSLLGTASLVFDDIARMPGGSTVCVGSTGRELTDDWTVLQSRLEQRGVRSQWFEVMLPDRLEASTVRAVRRTVESDARFELNSDLRPVGYFLDQTWWLTQFRPEAATLMARLSEVAAWQVLAPVFVITALLLAMIRLRPVRRATVPLAVGASGFAAMTLQVALLFAFQTLYGYVYHMIGLLIGAFMVGLAAGAIYADRWLRAHKEGRAADALPAALGIMALASVLLAPALQGMAAAGAASSLAKILFPLITALVGFAVGIVFPLGASAWEELSASAAAAWLYAADLIGAAAGAVLAGAFLVPVIGLPGTCLLAAAMAAAGASLTGARSLTGRSGRSGVTRRS